MHYAHPNDIAGDVKLAASIPDHVRKLLVAAALSPASRHHFVMTETEPATAGRLRLVKRFATALVQPLAGKRIKACIEKQERFDAKDKAAESDSSSSGAGAGAAGDGEASSSDSDSSSDDDDLLDDQVKLGLLVCQQVDSYMAVELSPSVWSVDRQAPMPRPVRLCPPFAVRLGLVTHV